MIRSNWTQNEILKILNLPLLELIFKAQKVYAKYFPKKDVQLASLLSIKTGACPEDCKYCPQSAHYKTGVKKNSLLSVNEVLKKAKKERIVEEYLERKFYEKPSLQRKKEARRRQKVLEKLRKRMEQQND